MWGVRSARFPCLTYGCPGTPAARSAAVAARSGSGSTSCSRPTGYIQDPTGKTKPTHSRTTNQREERGLAGIGTGTDVFDTYKRDEAGVGAGAGRQTTITKADFRFLNNRDAMRRIERLAEQLAARLPMRLGRRRKITRRTGQLALRPTLRASVRRGGLPLDPRYSMRKRELPRLVLLHDVSHSMTFNNPLLFRFTRGLVRRFGTAEAFVFHTRLFRVTPMYREVSLTRMRERLEENNWLWMGGTCIADSLAEFGEQYASSMRQTKTILIIIEIVFT